MKKRLLTLTLVATMIIGTMSGCGSSNNATKNNNTNIPNEGNSNTNGSQDFLDTVKFEIQGKQIILGKTTYGELSDIFTKASSQSQIDYIGYIEKHYKVKFVSNDNKSSNMDISLTLVSPKKNVATPIEDCIIQGVYINLFGENRINGLKINGNIITGDEKEEFFNEKFGGWLFRDDSIYNAPQLVFNCKSNDETLYAITYSDLSKYITEQFDYNIKDTDFNFTDINEDFTSNYMKEIRIDGKIYSVNNKISDFLNNENMFINNVYAPNGINLPEQGYISFDIDVYSRNGNIGKLTVSARNMATNTISAYDCQIEHLYYSPTDADTELYGGIKRGLSSEEVKKVFGEPNYINNSTYYYVPNISKALTWQEVSTSDYYLAIYMDYKGNVDYFELKNNYDFIRK